MPEVFNPRLKVLNFFAGPGSGKSTLAAGVFHALKFANVAAELVTEYAKDAVYRNDDLTLANQFYILAKQEMRLWRLRGQVHIAIVDSPILMSIAYSPSEDADIVTPLAAHLHNRYDNLNVLVKRDVNRYRRYGRRESAAQARSLDAKISDIFSLKTYWREPRLVVPSDPASVGEVVRWLIDQRAVSAEAASVFKREV